MYIQPAFQARDQLAVEELIESHPFATLFAMRDGQPQVWHLPLLRDAAAGKLVGHLPRAAAALAGEVTVVFHGPHAHVSPTPDVTPGLVPTWNYAAAHVQGVARIIDDNEAKAAILADISRHFEAGRWSMELVEGLPRLLPMIIGIEIDIVAVEAKFKLSQNRSAADIDAVASALAASAAGAATADYTVRHAGARIE